MNFSLYVSDAHPVIKAAQAHLKILTIHPFRYENGKTARLLMNLMLLQSGYAPAIILPEQLYEKHTAIPSRWLSEGLLSPICALL